MENERKKNTDAQGISELLTAAQMRAVEEAAIESGAVSGLELMERAGRGVVEAVFEMWPDLRAGSFRAVALCGPGNNGGDGFVVARLLKEMGWNVEVYLYGNAEKLPSDARRTYERWSEMGPVRPWDDAAIEDLLDAQDYALVVDALFGTGLTRPMPKDTERTWHGFVPTVTHNAPGMRPKYVAIDTPSGLCADSGANLGAFAVDLTVTFHRAKPGHYLLHGGHNGGGPGLCGKIVVKDIGLLSKPERSTVRLLDGSRAFWRKEAPDHKYSHGHALILSGGPGRTGAARLAARGALRMGAGLVTLGVPGSAQMEVSAQVTAVMLRRAGTVQELSSVLEDARINALCLGPGLGMRDEQVSLVAAALKSGRSLVLDADALTLISRDAALFDLVHERCVLTPHGGEFARLFPDLAEKLAATAEKGPAYSKVDATREAAARAGCVVLFKGPDTVIAAPNGECSVNAASYERAAPWLATAGAGDVLAGFVAGLLARGLGALRAAEAAAWLHVECARSFGPGLIAEDLPDELPKVFRALGP